MTEHATHAAAAVKADNGVAPAATDVVSSLVVRPSPTIVAAGVSKNEGNTATSAFTFHPRLTRASTGLAAYAFVRRADWLVGVHQALRSR